MPAVHYTRTTGSKCHKRAVKHIRCTTGGASALGVQNHLWGTSHTSRGWHSHMQKKPYPLGSSAVLEIVMLPSPHPWGEQLESSASLADESQLTSLEVLVHTKETKPKD